MEEKRKEEIRREARAILDKFAKSLEKVKVSGKKKEIVGDGTRVEGKEGGCDSDFRKRMFDNAPKKEGDCIVAEKASW